MMIWLSKGSSFPLRIPTSNSLELKFGSIFTQPMPSDENYTSEVTSLRVPSKMVAKSISIPASTLPPTKTTLIFKKIKHSKPTRR